MVESLESAALTRPKLYAKRIRIPCHNKRRIKFIYSFLCKSTPEETLSDVCQSLE